MCIRDSPSADFLILDPVHQYIECLMHVRVFRDFFLHGEALLDFIHEVVVSAVSYTHLDVYKRQVSGNPGKH